METKNMMKGKYYLKRLRDWAESRQYLLVEEVVMKGDKVSCMKLSSTVL